MAQHAAESPQPPAPILNDPIAAQVPQLAIFNVDDPMQVDGEIAEPVQAPDALAPPEALMPDEPHPWNDQYGGYDDMDVDEGPQDGVWVEDIPVEVVVQSVSLPPSLQEAPTIRTTPLSNKVLPELDNEKNLRLYVIGKQYGIPGTNQHFPLVSPDPPAYLTTSEQGMDALTKLFKQDNLLEALLAPSPHLVEKIGESHFHKLVRPPDRFTLCTPSLP